jgi:alkanesulfonate monooxygenase SsuD/methylene tetrahydromethanopterin reductase-like flavin-dependent oxidoreductase (luciferase family)
VGVSVPFTSHADWGRFRSRERGEAAPGLPLQPDAEIWAGDLALLGLIEELGYDSCWLVEHHLTPYSMMPNPLAALSFMAGATQRIGFGTMVIVLPWHDPLRVAEELTMLQYFAGDRDLTIGVGRGIARREFTGLSVPMEESRGRFNEAVEVIKLALEQPSFSFDGEHFSYDNVELRPHPRDPAALLENLYCAWGSRATVPIAAGYGLKPLIIAQKPWPQYRDELELFAAASAEHGYEPAPPIAVVVCHCTDGAASSRLDGAHWMREFSEAAVLHYELDGGHFGEVKGYEHYADPTQNLAGAEADAYVAYHVLGTPAECLAQIEGIVAAVAPSQLVFVMRFGTMGFDAAERSMRLFAIEVLPALHAMAEPATA